ncbi:MAG: GNAT family N-acetyltransferase [Anaerolineales bacterium]|jgi:aminoglycoside 2'-N-acetyltransferase I
MNHTFSLKIVSKSDLTHTEISEILALCSDAFEEDYAPYWETFENSSHILAHLDGQLVSHALWITRWLQIGSGPLMRTAYVEGVATDARYRSQGYASAVMERLEEEIIDYEIGGLSPAETSLYTRLGWEYWRGPLFHRKDGALIRDPADEAIMILRLPKTPTLDMTQPISVEWRKGEVW